MISNKKEIIPAQKKIRDISRKKIINNDEKNKKSFHMEKEVELNTVNRIFQYGILKNSKFNIDSEIIQKVIKIFGFKNTLDDIFKNHIRVFSLYFQKNLSHYIQGKKGKKKFNNVNSILNRIENDPRYLDAQNRRNLILKHRIIYLEAKKKFDLSLCIQNWRVKSLYFLFLSSLKTKKQFFEEFSKISSFNLSDNNEANMIKFKKILALKKLLPIKRRNNLFDLKYFLYKWKCNSRIIKSEQEKKLILKIMSLYSFYNNEINNKKITSQFLEKWRIISKCQSYKEKYDSIRRKYLKLNTKFSEPTRKLRNNALKIQIIKANEKMKKINNLTLYKQLKKWEKNSFLMKLSEEKEENNKNITLKNILKIKSKADKIKIISNAFNKWRFNLNNENKGNIDTNQNIIDKVFAKDIFNSCYVSNYMDYIYKRKKNLDKNFKFINSNNNLRNRFDLNINSKNIYEEEEKNNDSISLDEIKFHLDENKYHFDNNFLQFNKFINLAKCKFDDVKLNNYEIPKDIIINLEKYDMKVYFKSVNIEGIKYFPINCKKSDKFFTLEKKLYTEFPQFKEYNSKCYVNNKEIHKFKTIEENNIKNNDIISLFIIN